MNLTSTDPVAVSFDWNPAVKENRYITLQVRLDRASRRSSFDINLDLNRFSKSDLEQLHTILERRHNNTSTGVETTSAISWLLNIALAQEGVSPAERTARIRELMLCAPPPRESSYKEAYFAQQGENFLRESNLKDFYEQTKLLQGYPEVYQSWRRAVNTLTVPLPKGIHPGSPKEREELEIFFLALRHNPLSAPFATHALLVDRWSVNQLFLSAVADTINGKLTPDETKLSLEHWLLCGWLHSCFWLLSNYDRALLLGKRIYSRTDVSDDAVRKAVKRSGLKDWTDYQPKGTKAPCFVDRFFEGQQEICEILPRDIGQT